MSKNTQQSLHPPRPRALASRPDSASLLRAILENAVSLLKAQSGGIYLYYPERDELVLIADFRRPEDLGTTLKVSEGMAGRLVTSDDYYMIVDDYNAWHGRASIYEGRRASAAVIEVKLEWEQRIVGILYVDDVVGRKFADEDARLLRVFASQAAITLIHLEQEESWERLIESSPNAIVSNDANGRIQEFNQRATEILGYGAEEIRGINVSDLYM